MVSLRGVPLTDEEKELSKIAHDIYKAYPSDGKYVLGNGKLIICQSNAKTKELKSLYLLPWLIHLEIGQVEQTLTQVLQTANLALTWLSLFRAEECRART